MTHHTHETNNTTETLREPLDNTTELGGDAPLYENQPPAQFDYDPRNLGTLTARDMSAIEKAINASRDAGSTPEAIQHSVYTRLALLGIDPSATRDNNGLVVRFVDVNGKEDIRPIVIDSEDFGTRIRNAEMHAVEEDVVEEGNASTIDGADAERASTQEHAEMHADDEDVEVTDEVDFEEKRAQERFRGTLLEAPLRDVQNLEAVIKEHAGIYDSHRGVVSKLLDQAKRLTRALKDGVPVDPQDISYLAGALAPEVAALLNADKENAEHERLQAVRFGDTLGEVKHEARRREFSGDISESVDNMLRKAMGASEELVNNRRRNSGAMDQAHQQVMLLGRMLQELQYNSRGGEYYVAQIDRTLGELEQHLHVRESLRRDPAGLIQSMKQSLSHQ